ncbi:putative carbonyl reductase [Schistosoma mansoni]|uniref:putative carbonyl reductase n=1 Tax=Schistosoma mansoni TaxID=6183 RepID=UPI0001A63EB7|nr:putative carbonyl reductase [Schistosoma mansoni]|eukprot:XP_018654146.1 putative carbonyl reductase [Schistosoma mansoni]
MKLAFVTGSNKGIGFSIIEKLLKLYHPTREWDVFLTARNIGLGQEAVEKLSNKGLDVKFHQLDITDQNSRKAFLTFVERNYPSGINIAVNNAGIAYKANCPVPFGNQARSLMNTNFTSTVDFTEEFIPLLAENARSAENGTYSEKGWPSNAYGVSKMGLTKASFIFGEMLKDDPRGIVINSCCPGFVDTDMTDHKGVKTTGEGADTPFYLATLPLGSKKPINQFVYERRMVKWSK